MYILCISSSYYKHSNYLNDINLLLLPLCFALCLPPLICFYMGSLLLAIWDVCVRLVKISSYSLFVLFFHDVLVLVKISYSKLTELFFFCYKEL